MPHQPLEWMVNHMPDRPGSNHLNRGKIAMLNQDLEIFAVTVRHPRDARRFHNEHFQRHGIRHPVVRITGPEGLITDLLTLQERALLELEKGEDTVITLSCHNLPPTSPHAANVHWSRRTDRLELRLHVQRPGEPSLLETIEEQEKLDWEEARQHCSLEERPVPPRKTEPRKKEAVPRPTIRRLERWMKAGWASSRATTED